MTEIFTAWVTTKQQGHDIDKGAHTVLARVRSGTDTVELGINDGNDTLLLSPLDACATRIGVSSIPITRISYKKSTNHEASKTRLDLVFLR